MHRFALTSTAVFLGVAPLVPATLAAEPAEQLAGDADGALPGVARVGVAGPLRHGAALSASAGYGFLGDILAMDDSHHRAAGQLAATVRFADWVGFGLRLDGRYDRHLLPGADDDGWVGDPRLIARATREVGGDLAVGAQLNLWLPGAEAPDITLAATSLELVSMATVAPAGRPFTVSANAGIRVDKSAETIADPDALSLSDRLALGVSESHAILLGAGATYRAGELELLGEMTWDLLFGDQAPGVGDSPLVATAGARLFVADDLQLELLASARLSADPRVADMAPLVPVTPRLAVTAGVRFQLPLGSPSTESLEDGANAHPDPEIRDDGGGDLEATPAGQIRGLVRDFRGQPVRARVTLLPTGARVEVGADGAFSVEVPPGDYQIVVEHPGYAPQRRGVVVEDNQVTILNIDLERP
jgi:hypothetical protein